MSNAYDSKSGKTGKTGKGAKERKGMVSAYKLADMMPEVFSSPFQVLRLAKGRVIPCTILPRGTERRCSYLFDPKKVAAAMDSRFRAAV